MKGFVVAVLFFSCAIAFSQKKTHADSDPWAGTFKLNLSKSKISGPAPKEETVTITSATKDSIKYTIVGKDAHGNSYTITYEGAVGTLQPQMKEGKETTKIAYQMPSSHEFISEARGADGSTGTGTMTLSKDNKTITVQEHAKDPQGAEHAITMVYRRQSR